MLLRPDGLPLKKHILPLSARQVTYFIDPEALLRHLGDLPQSVKVAAFCQTCYERGLPEDVVATFDPSTRQWTVRCACADYPPIKSRGDGPLTTTRDKGDGTVETIKIQTVDELLSRLGWSFKCAAECERLGLTDGVEGNNDSQGKTLHVVCGCTDRIYREPESVH